MSEDHNEIKHLKGDPYENLADAIIVRAALDYRRALKGRNAQYKKEVLRFFRSAWFGRLTTLNPEYLIKRLEDECR